MLFSKHYQWIALIDKGEIPIFEITDRITTQRQSQEHNIHRYVSIKTQLYIPTMKLCILLFYLSFKWHHFNSYNMEMTIKQGDTQIVVQVLMALVKVIYIGILSNKTISGSCVNNKW